LNFDAKNNLAFFYSRKAGYFSEIEKNDGLKILFFKNIFQIAFFSMTKIVLSSNFL